MNKIKFANYLSGKLNPYLEPLGFSFVKSKSAFLNNDKEGWVRFNLGFYQFAGTNNFDISFEVRKNNIEELLVKYVDINPSEHKKTSTVLFVFSSLLGHKYKDGKFEFNETNSLDEIVERDVMPFLQQKIPIYVDRYRNLKNIYELFTNPNEENNKFIHFGYENCIRALIIGYRLYPDDINKVVDDCESQMMKFRQKWPNSLDVELFDSNFKKVVSSLTLSN